MDMLWLVMEDRVRFEISAASMQPVVALTIFSWSHIASCGTWSHPPTYVSLPPTILQEADTVHTNRRKTAILQIA